jgi:hypothetical protein
MVAKAVLLIQRSVMNRLFSIIVAVLFASFLSVICLQAQPFTSFGSASFTVVTNATKANYTQDALGLNFSPSVSLGDTVGGIWNNAPFDWSSYADLASGIYLKVVFTGANPASPMVLNIYNSDFSQNIQYEGTSVPIGEVIGAKYLPFAITPGTFSSAVLTDVGAAQITWGGSGTAGVRVEGLGIPEPSTYTLLAMSAAGALWLARRRR